MLVLALLSLGGCEGTASDGRSDRSTAFVPPPVLGVDNGERTEDGALVDELARRSVPGVILVDLRRVPADARELVHARRTEDELCRLRISRLAEPACRRRQQIDDEISYLGRCISTASPGGAVAVERDGGSVMERNGSRHCREPDVRIAARERVH